MDVVGDIVAVSAVPSAGYGFVSWTEGGVVVSPVADFTFIADVSHALVAHFAAPAAIDVSASSDAGGAVGGAASYGLAASATVIAAPNDGYTFTNWTDGGAVVSTAPIYTFTVTAARALVANFQPFPEVETTAGAPGSGVLVLSWPDMDHASVLQESTDLANWVASPRAASVVGSRKNVPASTAGAHRFFRLAHP